VDVLSATTLRNSTERRAVSPRQLSDLFFIAWRLSASPCCVCHSRDLWGCEGERMCVRKMHLAMSEGFLWWLPAGKGW